MEAYENRPRARRAGSTVTIKDVARLSGVSAATVTRALRGHPRVRPATRTRVVEAAERLGYRPNDVARTLVTGSSNTIGLLISSTSDRYWAEVVVGIEERAAEQGFSVLLASSRGDPARADRILELFLGKRVDGVVFTAAAGIGGRRLPPVPGPPAVAVGWDPRVEPGDFEAARTAPPADALAAARRRYEDVQGDVVFDDVEGARAAVSHLLSLGHRRIAVLGGSSVLSAVLRVLGCRLALAEAGLEPTVVIGCDDTLEGGRAAAAALLERERPTAIIAYSDIVAIGALRAAHSLGIRVPDEISVVGCDDIDVAAFVEPPLTTIRQPKREIGARAVALLLTRLEHGNGPLGPEYLPGEIVVRASTGPPTG